MAVAVDLTRAFANTPVGAGHPQSLIMDEAEPFAPARGLSRPMPDPIARGRLWGLSIIYAGKSRGAVNRILTSLTTRVLAFRSRGPGDLRYLRGFMAEEAAAAAPTVPKFAHLDIGGGGEWTMGRLPHPQHSGS